MRDSKSTVLLVEDDSADQEIILRVVQESGFAANVDIVASGNEAIEYLFKKVGQNRSVGEGFPDLIFLDLNLPGMSGFEILQRLKDEPEVKDIPVIVLSTSNAEEDINKSYSLGASSYVTKPASLQGFVEAMRQIERYWFDIVSLPDRGL